MVVLNTEELKSDLTPKDRAESMRGLMLISGVVVYWLYRGMDSRSIHESYPPGSLDRNLLYAFVSGSGSSGREIWTHPKVAFPFHPLLYSTQGWDP